jgi:CPA2 family monovalent cation:H+ antiporter-2
VLAAAGGDSAVAFIEIGAVALALSLLARLAGRLGITAIPLYLLAGLVLGEGGIAPLDVSAEFISLAGDIGVLLLLLALGLEYTGDELKAGLRASALPGVVDAVLGFGPGFAVGLALGWEPAAAVLLGGVCWVTSSGVAAKIITDLDRLGNRETPAILNLLVVEDLAMAVYLPVIGAIVVGSDTASTVSTVVIALVAVTAILTVALRWGHRLSAMLAPASDESLLLGVFGLTLLVGGLAEELEVSAAIGAFLVGVALSGPVQQRAASLVGPLRDLFAATFFLFFAFTVDPSDLAGALLPALGLVVLTAPGKFLAGWIAAGRLGVAAPGRWRAGATLLARGEFSIIIAALGATLADGEDLAALAAAYVLLTAVLGPFAARFVPAVVRRHAHDAATPPERMGT